MTEGTEAAADALTGAVVATAVEEQTGAAPAPRDADEAHAACRNCGGTLTGRYCAACGQPAQVHRSFASLGHDILHSVLHFDSKLWRTLPELAIYPGRLTRRYIDGERAKFISPMALYLFSVFLMYAVFSFTGGPVTNDEIRNTVDFQGGVRGALETTRQNIETLEDRLEEAGLTAEERVELEAQLAEAESGRTVLEAVDQGDLERLKELEEASAERGNETAQTTANKVDGSKPEGALAQGFAQFRDNPSLMSYKLKTNGYKYSWALVPLSIPFMWLLFFWRRDIRVYDHAVFVTYSISFMILLLVLAALLQTAGVANNVIEKGVQVAVPLHMYRQLRGTYGLSRPGAIVRLFFLLIAAAIVLTLFIALLLVIGALG
jgi:ribosomal protein L37E